MAPSVLAAQFRRNTRCHSSNAFLNKCDIGRIGSFWVLHWNVRLLFAKDAELSVRGVTEWIYVRAGHCSLEDMLK